MNERERIRDVYAHFGLALYLAQVLEHAIVNAMVATRLPHRERATRTDIAAFMGDHFEKPLGRLIAGLGRYVAVPEASFTQLRAALQTRNWLAHHYFRERAVEFTNDSGRVMMIDELQSAQRLFEEVEASVTAIVRPIEERYGITKAEIAEYERRVIRGHADG
jgi:hypothetical protein